MSKKNIHEEIHALLAKGVEVKSLALGRVGMIVEVNIEENTLFPVTIKPPRGTYNGVTTFLKGDEVKLEKVDAKHWRVTNVWPEDEKTGKGTLEES